MAHAGTPLDIGDALPALAFETVAHGRIELPEYFEGRWGVVLLFRAHWCSYCARQLAAFQQGIPELEYAGIRVVATSADDEDGARRLAELTGAMFPVGYGLPVLQTAERLGAYYDEKRGIVHTSGFIVQPDGTVAVASYSSGAVGRLAWEDVVRLVAFWEPKA